MGLCYENIDEAAAKISRSFIMYDDEPFIVDTLTYSPEDRKIILLTLVQFHVPPEIKNGKDLKILSVPLTDPKLNATKYRLGYFYDPYVKEAVFCTRKPRRQWLQGLRADRLNFTYANAGEGKRHHIDDALLRRNKTFSDMLQGVYPSFEEAKKVLDLDDSIKSVPFSRVFALGKDKLGRYDIFYRGEPVAWSPNGAKEAVLSPSFSHLKETFEEVGIRI